MTRDEIKVVMACVWDACDCLNRGNPYTRYTKEAEIYFQALQAVPAKVRESLAAFAESGELPDNFFESEVKTLALAELPEAERYLRTPLGALIELAKLAGETHND